MPKLAKFPKEIAELKKLPRLAALLFLVGIVMAVIAGLAVSALGADAVGTVTTALVVFGIIVGLLAVFKAGTIRRGETLPFLIAAIALIVGSSAGANLATIPYVGREVVGIVGFLSVFVVPIAIIVAAKSIWEIGRD